MKHLDRDELKKYHQLIELMSLYESSNSARDRSEILSKINLIADVSEFSANEYYSSSSLEEFCTSLAIIQANGNLLSKDKAEAIVAKILNSNDLAEQDYLRSKYSDAIEFVYKKNTGFFVNCLYHEELSISDFIAKLEGSQGGSILL